MSENIRSLNSSTSKFMKLSTHQLIFFEPIRSVKLSENDHAVALATESIFGIVSFKKTVSDSQGSQ